MPIDLEGFSHCERQLYTTPVVLEAKGSKAIFHNPRRLLVRKFEIDGCVIKDGIRCDYLLVVSSPNRDIYVELKGCDVARAIKQLEGTMKRVRSNRPKVERQCFIVATRVLTKARMDIPIFKRRFKRDFNATLVIKNNVLQHEI